MNGGCKTYVNSYPRYDDSDAKALSCSAFTTGTRRGTFILQITEAAPIEVRQTFRTLSWCTRMAPSVVPRCGVYRRLHSRDNFQILAWEQNGGSGRFRSPRLVVLNRFSVEQLTLDTKRLGPTVFRQKIETQRYLWIFSNKHKPIFFTSIARSKKLEKRLMPTWT